jgi:hypothetical protein
MHGTHKVKLKYTAVL